jgi:glycosyltransferase involved in cell wall biosynthesis
MKIIGITRIRNESHIIADTLRHVSRFIDEIIVLDDCSTDNTIEICRSFPKVKAIIHTPNWTGNPYERARLEGLQRQTVYNIAVERSPDWIYCFDADEFADFNGIDFTADAYKLRLFDYYITEEDKDLPYTERKWIGPEYRDILMLFRPHPAIRFTSRTPILPKNYVVKTAGFVKHYGKAISIEEWEKTCHYYMNHLNERGIKKKWTARVGKAVHTVSDFGKPLITWDERIKKGIPLIDNQI